MAELLIKGTKIAEKVNNVILQYGDMYLNKQTHTDDLTIDSANNGFLTGPITANNLTVQGNLTIFNELNITGDLNITGSLKFIG